jgi:toxin ParE1/3/4
MATYKLTKEADFDIDEIWEESNLRWGKTQARKYLDEMEERFISLAENPKLGKKRPELTGSPMSFPSGRHVIFYRKAKKGIEIIRVLHDSMDFPRHI